jgi:glutamyl-tRNA synthetase
VKEVAPSIILKQLNREISTNVLEFIEIEKWIDFINDFSLNTLEKHLNLKSFIVGYKWCLADVVVWGVVSQKEKELKKFVNVTRWFQNLKEIPEFSKSLKEFTNAKPSVVQEQGHFDIELKNVEMGKVVTRFPPEPSGYLHIGHAKAALLNDYFARLYKGKLLLRFDDTNPSKEKMEYENSIKEDLELLGIRPDHVSHTSDHFPKIYDYALQMIQKGLAYVDDTDQETMRAQRFDGIDSKCRNKTVEENLKDFTEMKKGTEFGLKSCLRAKIDMSDKNKAMRDPVIYRCNLIPHPHTGTTYKMYPTYDFVCPIVDSIEGVTHALRTNEYRDRNPQYEWFLKALGLRWVNIWDYSRLNFVYTLLSKRKLTWFVEQGLVSGWDDPRFATVRGIRRRGMTIEALRSYILSQGASQRELSLEWDKLWVTNKKVIDPVAPRHTALIKDKL